MDGYCHVLTPWCYFLKATWCFSFTLWYFLIRLYLLFCCSNLRSCESVRAWSNSLLPYLRPTGQPPHKSQPVSTQHNVPGPTGKLSVSESCTLLIYVVNFTATLSDISPKGNLPVLLSCFPKGAVQWHLCSGWNIFKSYKQSQDLDHWEYSQMFSAVIWDSFSLFPAFLLPVSLFSIHTRGICFFPQY